MQPYRARDINHVSFTVESIARSVEFFRECLGAEVISIRRPGNPAGIPRITGVAGASVQLAFVRLGAQLIELIEYEAPMGRKVVSTRPCDVGFAHLAIDVEGLMALVAAAARHGYQPMGEVVEVLAGPEQGKRAAYLRGPDGITLELIG